MVAVLLGFAIPLAIAQDERPQIMPGTRKAPRKKDSGPRAIGIVQLGKNGKASIIPVAILINGKFWDASAYKADPVPMALDSGNVYEGERTGSSLGLFTVGSALHSNNPNAAMPWLGTGVWRANGTEAPETAKKAESAPAGISAADDGPPRLTRDPNANKPAPSASGAPPSNTSSQPSKPSSGDEPPRLTKGSTTSDSSQSAPATNAPAPSNPPAQSSNPSSNSEDGPPKLNRRDSSSGSDSGSPQSTPASGQSKPTDSKSADPTVKNPSTSQTKSGDQAKSKEPIAPSDSGTSESNRPRLRRGKPAESFADEDIPGYSRPGAHSSSAKDEGKVVQTVAANTADVQLIPAISDAA